MTQFGKLCPKDRQLKIAKRRMSMLSEWPGNADLLLSGRGRGRAEQNRTENVGRGVEWNILEEDATGWNTEHSSEWQSGPVTLTWLPCRCITVAYREGEKWSSWEGSASSLGGLCWCVCTALLNGSAGVFALHWLLHSLAPQPPVSSSDWSIRR